MIHNFFFCRTRILSLYRSSFYQRDLIDFSQEILEAFCTLMGENTRLYFNGDNTLEMENSRPFTTTRDVTYFRVDKTSLRQAVRNHSIKKERDKIINTSTINDHQTELVLKRTYSMEDIISNPLCTMTTKNIDTAALHHIMTTPNSENRNRSD